MKTHPEVKTFDDAASALRWAEAVGRELDQVECHTAITIDAFETSTNAGDLIEFQVEYVAYNADHSTCVVAHTYAVVVCDEQDEDGAWLEATRKTRMFDSKVEARQYFNEVKASHS